MTGPGWLVGPLAALMILVATVAAACGVRSRLSPGTADVDADMLHVLMGVAMAGMFEPRLRAVPAAIWLAVFTGGAMWFIWKAIRGRGRSGQSVRFGHPLAHAIECGAMVYMLWPAASPLANERSTASMTGMAGWAGAIAGNPVVALVLAAFLLGYVLWTIDQFSSGAWKNATALPAPRLAVCQKITMSLAMGYMLVTML